MKYLLTILLVAFVFGTLGSVIGEREGYEEGYSKGWSDAPRNVVGLTSINITREKGMIKFTVSTENQTLSIAEIKE